MLSNLPDETTQFLVDLCTGTLGSSEVREDNLASPLTKASGAGYLQYLALNRASASDPPASAQANGVGAHDRDRANRASASESHQSDKGAGSRVSTPAPTIRGFRPPPPPEKLPSPRVFFPHFIGHYTHFV